jgi:hypothetical protein
MVVLYKFRRSTIRCESSIDALTRLASLFIYSESGLVKAYEQHRFGCFSSLSIQSLDMGREA